MELLCRAQREMGDKVLQHVGVEEVTAADGPASRRQQQQKQQHPKPQAALAKKQISAADPAPSITPAQEPCTMELLCRAQREMGDKVLQHVGVEEVTAADGPASRRQQQQQQQQQPKQQQPPPKQHQKPQQQQQVPHFVQRAYDLVVAAVEDAVDCGSDPRLASGKLLAAAAKNTTTDVLCSAGLTVLAYMLPFSTGKAVPAQLVNVKGDGNCQVSAIVVAMGKPEPGIKAVEKFRTASTNALEARIKKPVMAARDLEVEGKDLLLGECRGGEKTADHVIKRLNKPWEYLEQASLYGASIHLGVTIIVFNARQPPQVIRTAGVRPQGRMVAIASFEEGHINISWRSPTASTSRCCGRTQPPTWGTCTRSVSTARGRRSSRGGTSRSSSRSRRCPRATAARPWARTRRRRWPRTTATATAR